MSIDPQIVAFLAVGGLALGAVLLVAVIVLAVRLRTVSRRYRRVFASGELDAVGVLESQGEAITALARGLDAADAEAHHLRELLARTVSRVGLVRYDAFEDVGGGLSFSTAFLDEHADGVVLTAINGRAETRCYAKPITAGVSAHHLSAEEEAALAEAVEGRRTSALATGRGRRRVS